MIFTKNSFRNTNRVPKGLDLDLDPCVVGLDLDPNCLQRLSADDKSRCQQGKSHDFLVVCKYM